MPAFKYHKSREKNAQEVRQYKPLVQAYGKNSHSCSKCTENRGF